MGKTLIGMVYMGMVLMSCIGAKKNETDVSAGTENLAIVDEEQDYEYRLEEAVAVLEEQLAETGNGDDAKLSEAFTDAVNADLPEYIRLRDNIRGDIGKDGKCDIAVVLQFTKDYPYETGDGVLAYGENILCIFTETEQGNYQCLYKNNRLIRDDGSGGMVGDPYAGMKIFGGLLTVSDYSGDASRQGKDFTFGFGQSGVLELFSIRRYEYYIHTGEGTVEYYDFHTGMAEGYNIEDCNEDEPLALCFERSFSVDPEHPILFEDTVGGQLLNIEYD